MLEKLDLVPFKFCEMKSSLHDWEWIIINNIFKVSLNIFEEILFGGQTRNTRNTIG